jgi:hypothetical protein
MAGGIYMNIDGVKDIQAINGFDGPYVANHFKDSYRFSGFSASFFTSILKKGNTS